MEAPPPNELPCDSATDAIVFAALFAFFVPFAIVALVIDDVMRLLSGELRPPSFTPPCRTSIVDAKAV